MHTPPMQQDLRPVVPAWLLVGPGFGALVGLFQLTVVFSFDGPSTLQATLNLSSQSFLLTTLVTFLVAGAVASWAGLQLGARLPTSLTIAADCLILIGTLLVAFAPGGGLLLVARVLTGLGTGAAVGVTVALILRLAARRGATAAVFAVLGILALIIAPLLGGMITEAVTFRLVHLIAAVFAFGALLVAGIVGIVALVTRRPAPTMPYGPPYQGGLGGHQGGPM